MRLYTLDVELSIFLIHFVQLWKRSYGPSRNSFCLAVAMDYIDLRRIALVSHGFPRNICEVLLTNSDIHQWLMVRRTPFYWQGMSSVSVSTIESIDEQLHGTHTVVRCPGTKPVPHSDKFGIKAETVNSAIAVDLHSIKPILSENCQQCTTTTKRMLGSHNSVYYAATTFVVITCPAWVKNQKKTLRCTSAMVSF